MTTTICAQCGEMVAVADTVCKPSLYYQYMRICAEGLGCRTPPPPVLPSGHWVGPYGCRVPNTYHQCVSDDGGNWLYRDGGETEMWVAKSHRPTQAEWLAKYTVLHEDGYHIYGPPVPSSVAPTATPAPEQRPGGEGDRVNNVSWEADEDY